MVNVLELPQTTISRQLAVLKNAGLVEDEREGTWMKYSITSSLDSFQKETLDTLKKRTAEEDSFLLDIASFDRKRQAGELVLFCNTEEDEGRKTA